MLVVFEGIDGAGKTTMFGKTIDYLVEKNLPVLGLKGTKGICRELLAKDEIPSRSKTFLYLAERANLVKEYIFPNRRNKIIVMDRYMDSSYAYQVMGQDVDSDLMFKMNEYATYGIRPTVTFLLAVDLETAKQRNPALNERLSDNASKGYKILSELYKDYELIDATGTVEDTWKHIKDILDDYLDKYWYRKKKEPKQIISSTSQYIEKSYDQDVQHEQDNLSLPDKTQADQQ